MLFYFLVGTLAKTSNKWFQNFSTDGICIRSSGECTPVNVGPKEIMSSRDIYQGKTFQSGVNGFHASHQLKEAFVRGYCNFQNFRMRVWFPSDICTSPGNACSSLVQKLPGCNVVVAMSFLAEKDRTALAGFYFDLLTVYHFYRCRFVVSAKPGMS